MRRWKNWVCALMLVLVTIAVCACGTEEKSASLEGYEQNNQALAFDNSKWNYDADNDVYWQVKVSYCSEPETTDYETMGIYVPGAYFKGEKNSDGTYTCIVNHETKIRGYTGDTAPIVFPINTAGYSAQAAPEDYNYESVSEYLQAGFIYVHAGMRGRDNGYDSSGSLTYSGGAPWGVTDLKAAVRYYRYNNDSLPGDTDRIFTFGHSGGGAQSALMGATGDSELYNEYLVSIGAAMFDEDGNSLSDAICGAMCWCPITSLDYADAAYEWNMGQYSTEGTRAENTWTSALSQDLAESYAAYINDLQLADEEGEILKLEKSADGIYTSGSYYNYLLSVIETSLNHFLNDTEFPYAKTSDQEKSGGGFGGGAPGSEGKPDDGSAPDGKPQAGKPPEQEIPDNQKMEQAGNEKEEERTYASPQEYIDDLNGDGKWVEYDAKTGKATVISMEGFVKHCKQAGKAVGAFDDTNRSQAENKLFGNDDNDALHFDSQLANLLEKNQSKYEDFDDWESSIVEDYKNDLGEVDKLGTDLQTRQNMYNPMYDLSSYYKGENTSTVAPYWRIRSGIEQNDTALTTETNLALALKQNESVKDVDFETVWGQGHTSAERSGNSSENFIKWINDCLK